MSCPALYFDFGIAPTHVHFQNYESGDVVFGGGGLLQRGDMDKPFTRAAADKKHLKIIWGAGVNTEAENYPEWLYDFDLVGLRDHVNPHEYVPCASCMHPLFRRCKLDRFGILAISHFSQPLKLNLAQVDDWLDYPAWWEFHWEITRIAKARVVITNSYHACYYAMLLGKPVVVMNPWNAKFHTLKYPPTFCDESNWEQACKDAEPTPRHYFEECRDLNVAFAAKVKSLIHERYH